MTGTLMSAAALYVQNVENFSKLKIHIETEMKRKIEMKMKTKTQIEWNSEKWKRK